MISFGNIACLVVVVFFIATRADEAGEGGAGGGSKGGHGGSGDKGKEWKAMWQECAEKEGANATQFPSWKSSEPVDDKTKCAMKCMAVKKGFIDANGNVNVTKIDSFLGRFLSGTPLNDIKSQCIKEKVANCEDFFTMKTCCMTYFKNMKKPAE